MGGRSIGAAMVLCCSVACGPPTVGIEGGDEVTPEETSLGDGDGDESSDSGSDDDSDECPPWPEVIGCGYGSDCPEGFKCGSYSGEDCLDGSAFGDLGCVPVIGDRGLGQTCTISFEDATPAFQWHLDDCTADGYCMSHAKGLEGTCVPYCEWASETMPSCADPERLCQPGGVSSCLQQCDPTAAEDTCEGEFICGPGGYWNPEFLCVSGDFSLGEGQLGDDCSSASGCLYGLGCVDGELLPDCNDTGCCSPYCSLVDVDPCASLGPAFTCMPFYAPGEAPPSLEHVGLCASP